MPKIAAMILGGGRGSRMDILCNERSKLALPFAGKFRVIDFSLSNCLNSKISKIAIVVDYQRQSLSNYLRDWSSVNGADKSLDILEPVNGSYQGTADAIRQNLNYIEMQNPDYLIVLAGDHIYRMDYGAMVSFHKKAKAEVTIGVIPVPLQHASRFGIVTTNHENRIINFVEKPQFPAGNLASMGIYIFNRKVITRFLLDDSLKNSSTHDIGYSVIPEMMRQNIRMFACMFNSYWEDIGTMESYYRAHMNLIADSPSLSLNGKWPVLTKNSNIGLARIYTQDNVTNSIISQGCIIKGKVTNSILSPGVVVEENATIKNSIIMENTLIGANSTVDSCILDEDTQVGKFCYLGFPSKSGWGDSKITVIGRRTSVPSYTAVEQNSKLLPDISEIDFLRQAIPACAVVSAG